MYAVGEFMISILIPSYGRAEKARRAVNNVIKNTVHPYEIIFIVEPKQLQEYVAELEDMDVLIVANSRSRNYAGAINSAVEWADGDFLFMGSDDLNFHPGWESVALATMNALDNIKVVGTNDLFNNYVLQGVHATHYLVEQKYIQDIGGVVDGERGHVLFEGYDHNYTDTEFIGTAKARAVFAPCLGSVVEHIGWTTGDFQDETKAKTNLKLDDDSRLYQSRQHLWQELSK